MYFKKFNQRLHNFLKFWGSKLASMWCRWLRNCWVGSPLACFLWKPGYKTSADHKFTGWKAKELKKHFKGLKWCNTYPGLVSLFTSQHGLIPKNSRPLKINSSSFELFLQTKILGVSHHILYILLCIIVYT